MEYELENDKYERIRSWKQSQVSRVGKQGQSAYSGSLSTSAIWSFLC